MKKTISTFILTLTNYIYLQFNKPTSWLIIHENVLTNNLFVLSYHFLKFLSIGLFFYELGKRNSKVYIEEDLLYPVKE